MRVLVVGGGGREHALAWKLQQSPSVEALYCAPGNPGIERVAECVAIAPSDFDALVDFARKETIDLTVVGPEGPLAGGIVDRFQDVGLTIFGPTAAAAQIESSKSFAKGLMKQYGIPTAAHETFDNAENAKAYVNRMGAPIVIKADGLSAGKGVTVANTVDEALEAVDRVMVDHVFGDAGNRVVVEECLVGEEASIFALTDGENVLPLASSQDHKPLLDGDRGPNTGGMGAYSPAPVVTDALFKEIEDTILRPCIEGMAKEGSPYRGVLFAGLMISDDGPKVVEFNCRFGDPEAQVLLPRMRSDLAVLLLSCCEGTLGKRSVEWDDGACVTVVMASGGYPATYEKGKAITGIEAAEALGLTVFHAGTARTNGELVTNGGRVIGVTAMGPDVPSTIAKAYQGVEKIAFEGAVYRKDIGRKALRHLT